MHDIVHTPSASPTAAVCEGMALFGTTPERGERDSRVIWDEEDAIDALGEAIRIILDGITVDGTQMAGIGTGRMGRREAAGSGRDRPGVSGSERCGREARTARRVQRWRRHGLQARGHPSKFFASGDIRQETLARRGFPVR